MRVPAGQASHFGRGAEVRRPVAWFVDFGSPSPSPAQPDRTASNLGPRCNAACKGPLLRWAERAGLTCRGTAGLAGDRASLSITYNNERTHRRGQNRTAWLEPRSVVGLRAELLLVRDPYRSGTLIGLSGPDNTNRSRSRILRFVVSRARRETVQARTGAAVQGPKLGPTPPAVHGPGSGRSPALRGWRTVPPRQDPA